MWDEIREQGRELLVPAPRPTFRVVTEGPHRLLGQEMTDQSERQGLVRVGVRVPGPLLVGAAKVGAGKGARLTTPVEGRRGSACVKGQEGWHLGTFRGAEGKGPEAHCLCVIPDGSRWPQVATEPWKRGHSDHSTETPVFNLIHCFNLILIDLNLKWNLNFKTDT